MQQSEISTSVLLYIAQNNLNFLNTMPDEHYFEISFPRKGRSRSRETDVHHGVLVDVIANLIEQGRFFGEQVSESYRQARRFENAYVKPMDAQEEYDITEQGLIVISRIAPKPYLNPLRTPEGFAEAAEKAGVDGIVEKIFK